MRCPNCKNKLLQKQGDTTRVRTQGSILIKSDGAHCQCFWCKAEVVLPIQVMDGSDIPEERFYLGKPPEQLTISGSAGTFKK